MKKLKRLINNVYRICIVNPSGRKRYTNLEGKIVAEKGLVHDTMLRQIVTNDPLPFEADPQLGEILRQRVRDNRETASPEKNSFLDILVPLFSSQHIEIKMAVVSLALFILVGLGPKSNQSTDKKMHLFFLADTLEDSSALHHPAAQDTAFLRR